MYIQYVINVITYLYGISSLQKQYCVLYICFDSYSALYTRLISLHWKITQYPHVTCSFKPPLLGASTLYLPSPKVVTKSHAILQLQKRSVGPRCYSIYIYIHCPHVNLVIGDFSCSPPPPQRKPTPTQTVWSCSHHGVAAMATVIQHSILSEVGSNHHHQNNHPTFKQQFQDHF